MIKAYKLNVYRCKLCGEAILSIDKLPTCPFCGAHDDYIVEAKDWKDENDIKNLSEISKSNLEEALNLEMDNARFYRCSSSYSQDSKNQATFKILSKVEAEHASAISRVLKRSKEDMGVQNICFRLDRENIKNSIEREEKAKEFYTNAYNQADEPRVKEIFFGLIEIENDHIELLKRKEMEGI